MVNQIPIKTPGIFLKNKNRQSWPKICIEMQGTQNNQNNLEKVNMKDSLFLIENLTTVIKIVWLLA